MRIKVNNGELKEVDHFKYLRSVLTKDGYCTKNRELKEFHRFKYLVPTRGGYCTREIKMRIVIEEEAFNRKESLLTSKLNIQLKKKLVKFYVWSIAL